MKPKIRTTRRFVALGVLALVAGAAGGQAAGSGPAAAPAKPRTPRAAAVPASPVPCRPASRATSKAPPSEALKRAFSILRRERTEADALPARARKALEANGLQPVDAQASRLLRGSGDARAWVVPIPDVLAGGRFKCHPLAVRAKGPAAQEGLAVVALGGAPAGGGGTLRDLQRGVAGPAVDHCAGRDGRMLGISGIVPDGVEAVYVSAADGSAIRADVHDNAYEFVLARQRRPQQRYVVWSASGGTPHVQPLPPLLTAGAGNRGCRLLTRQARVTPGPWGSGCGALGSAVRIAPATGMAIDVSPRRTPRAAPPAPARAPRAAPPAGRAAPRRLAPDRVPPIMALQVGPCLAGYAAPVVVPGGPPVLVEPAPKPPRSPRPAPAPPRRP